MKGIQITNGTTIPYANPDDFTVNTLFLGGMKVNEKKIFDPAKDFLVSSGGYRYLVYPHNLTYVPAVIAFQAGQQSVGWQNGATIDNVSANADNKYVYMETSTALVPDTLVYLIIFGEKVADV